MKQQLSFTIKRLLSYFPTPLPVGMTHYKTWLDSVVELVGPIATEDDIKFCVSAEVIRLGPGTCNVAKNYLVKRVRAGAAKQIAGAVFTEIKENQQAAQLAAKQAAEVTAAKQEATTSNGETTALN